MAFFTDAEIAEDLAGLSGDAFAKASVPDRMEFAKFVCGIDENAKAKHDLRFYTGTARAMAEIVHGVNQEDFSDEFIRESLRSGLVPNDKPFESSGPDGWRDFTLTPAMVSLAFRVQKKCQKNKETSSAGVDASGVSAFQTAMQQFVQATTNTSGASSAKKGLTFDLANRIREVGLAAFPKDGIPSEETLAKFEQAGKVAAEKQRKWIGSADGECLQTHHRPEWSRTPVLAAPPTGASLQEKLKHVLDDKKTRSEELKLDFQSFATFLGHVFEWGIKCVLMQAITPVELMAYMFNLCHVAEEYGGVRTCYQYDVYQRKAMARSLERGEGTLSDFFTVLNKDLARESKEKVAQKMKESNNRGGSSQGQQQSGSGGFRSSGGSAGSGGPGPKGQSKSAKGHLAPTSPRKKRSRSPKRAGNGGKGGSSGSNQGWQGNQSWQGNWWVKK